MAFSRRRRVGAEPSPGGGAHFRVWAPAARRVSVVIDAGAEHELETEAGGYFAGFVGDARAGTRYRFRLDGKRETFPDPASRFQPEGPHGSSQVVDPAAYRWHDASWRGRPLKGTVIYEMHVGTFTTEGTYAAAMARLDDLADVGVNTIEVMPLHAFPGRFGWGYDGVDLWAPVSLYGTPDDLRRFVDEAHAHQIAIILDVVYNHFGPDGCYLREFSPDYFTTKYENDWGDSINFDGTNACSVREFFTENAAHWIDEYHFDGLRLDATQSINDASEKNILSEIVERARAAGERRVFFVGENEPQDVRLLEEYGVDALWNDDWHHSATVALTGKTEAYYTDYRGTPQEFVSMAKLGFLYRGQRYQWQKQRRGTPSAHIAPERFVAFLQNHDQIANSARGDRIHALTAPGRLRAMTALLLLAPHTPMLFQGQEFAASARFQYFADHKSELAKLVGDGRREFLRQFPSLRSDQDRLAAPEDPQTFETAKLDWRERDAHTSVVALHRDLIRLRREDPMFAQQRSGNLHGAVLTEQAFVLRWLTGTDDDRLLLINLGPDLHLDPAPEPLLAPPRGGRWQLLWSSEDPRYGGAGTPPLESEKNWLIPGCAAVVCRPSALGHHRPPTFTIGKASRVASPRKAKLASDTVRDALAREVLLGELDRIASHDDHRGGSCAVALAPYEDIRRGAEKRHQRLRVPQRAPHRLLGDLNFRPTLAQQRITEAVNPWLEHGDAALGPRPSALGSHHPPTGGTPRAEGRGPRAD